jgi:hypothetical protein
MSRRGPIHSESFASVALDEARERLTRLGDPAGPVLLRHGDARAPVVIVVGAEGHHRAARHLVGKEVLQLTQIGGLGSGADAGVHAPDGSQVERRLDGEIEPVAVDVQLRASRPQAAVGAAFLAAVVLGQNRLVGRVHRRGLLHDDAPTRSDDEQDVLPAVRRDALVDARAEHDVRDAEGAGEQLNVGDDVALAPGEDARGRLEIRRRLGQSDDVLA